MDYTEALEKVTILKIPNLMPRRINDRGTDSNIKSGFLLLARENGKFVTLQDLDYYPDEKDSKHITSNIELWGGGNEVKVNNGLLKMELPTFLNSFFNKLISKPGCRISPNLLRIDEDVYLSIEYPDILTGEVKQVVNDFMKTDYIFDKKIIYTRIKRKGLPPLLWTYNDVGKDLHDFVVVSTLWEFNSEERNTENQGVFTNTGYYVVKGFTNGEEDVLIFRKSDSNVSGISDYAVVDEASHVVEFKVKSKFFSDFYNQVISKSVGPIFMYSVIDETSQRTQYIIRADREAVFTDALKKHWLLENRKNHKNTIVSVESLDEILNHGGWNRSELDTNFYE